MRLQPVRSDRAILFFDSLSDNYTIFKSTGADESAVQRKDVRNLRDKRDIDGLIRALDDVDEYVRMDAASALGAVGDRRALEPLNRVKFYDDSGDVRRVAGVAQIWLYSRLEQEQQAKRA